MDFSWLAELMSGLPTEMRFVLIMLLLGIAYKIVDMKYINGNWSQDNHIDIHEQIANIEKHVTNHLTHDLQDLTGEIKNL